MTSDRVLKLFIVATVLAAAWYAGREAAPALAITVVSVGLAAAFWRPVLGIPVALAMVAAAVYVPGVAIGAMVLVRTARDHCGLRQGGAQAWIARAWTGSPGQRVAR